MHRHGARARIVHCYVAENQCYRAAPTQKRNALPSSRILSNVDDKYPVYSVASHLAKTRSLTTKRVLRNRSASEIIVEAWLDGPTGKAQFRKPERMVAMEVRCERGLEAPRGQGPSAPVEDGRPSSNYAEVEEISSAVDHDPVAGP